MARRQHNLRYQVYRSAAMQLTAKGLDQDRTLREAGLDPAGIRLEPITSRAIDATLKWTEAGGRFPWEGVPSWKARDPKAFDLSLWYEADLCGLCYATPRQSAIRIKLVLLEGRPGEPHPLKGFVLPIAAAAIAHYGRAIGAQLIEVDTPLPGAIAMYQALGFAFDTEARLVIAVCDA